MFIHHANKLNTLGKQFAGFMKLSLLLLSAYVISSCMGVECKLVETETGEVHQCLDLSTTSSVPVNYINPQNNQNYEYSELAPQVEFPEGIPTNPPQFILNGADVTADFNCAGTLCTALPLGAGPGQANAIHANLRDGRNAFQVAKPEKAMIFFNVNMPGAEVHILSVDDGWTGETFRILRDGNGDVQTRDVNGTNVARRAFHPKRGNMVVTGYVEGKGYKNIQQMCVNTFTMNANGNLTALTMDGASICDTPALGRTTEPGGFYLDFGQADLAPIGQFETPVVGAGAFQYYTGPIGLDNAWTASNIVLIGSGTAPWGSPAIPEGAQIAGIQGTNSMIRTITVGSGGDEYRIDLFAAQRNSNATFQRVGVYVDGGLVGNIQPAAGGVFEGVTLSLGTLAAGDHTLELRGLNPNGGDNTVFVDDIQIWNADGDVLYTFEFNIRDTGNNNLNYTESETDMVEITIQDSYGVHSTRWLRSNVPIWDSRMGSDGGFSLSFDRVAMLSTGLGVADLIHGQVIAGYGEPHISAGDFTVTELYLGNDSTFQITIPTQNNQTSGRIDIAANLEMRIYVDTPWYCLGDMSSGTRNAFFPYNAQVTLNIDKSGTGFGDVAPYITNVTMGGSGINLDSIGGGLCGGFLGIFGPMVNDTVSGIVANVVGGIVANDLPTMRAKVGIKVPTGSGSSDFGPFYLTLHPEVTDFYAIPKAGAGSDQGVKWGLMMGMHTRGVNAARHSDPTQRAVRNASLGIKWTGTPSVASKARLSANLADESVPALGTTLGAMLTQDFVNQLLLGLWESGFVFFDQLEFAMPGGVTDPLLDNLNITFATRMPWEISFYPDGHPAGDAQLYFPDLVVEVRGDLYYPEFQESYNFATMVADIYFNVNIDGSPDGSALRISVANTLEIEVQSVSSDWDDTSEDQLIAALDSVFTDLSAGLEIDIPFPEILSSTVDIKGVYSDEQGLYVPIDVYNPQRYPDGPDGPLFDYTFHTINASNSNSSGWRNLTNGVDDDLNVAPGFYPFHLQGRGRNNTRDCSGGYYSSQTCTPYYYTEASFDWGFEHRFNGVYRLKAIGIDKRNDCCAARGNNITVQVRSGGVWQTVGTTSQGGNGVETISFTPRDVDRVRYLVLRTEASPAGNGTSGPWVSNGDKLGRVGDGSMTMNITETTYTFEPLL